MTSRRTRVPAIRPGAGTPCSPRAIAAAGSHTAVEMPIGLPVCHHPLMADIGPIAYLLARARWRPVGVELARTDLPVTTSESSRRYRPRAPRRSQMPPHRDRALSRGPALSYHAGVCGDGTPFTSPTPLPGAKQSSIVVSTAAVLTSGPDLRQLLRRAGRPSGELSGTGMTPCRRAGWSLLPLPLPLGC